MNRRNTEGFQGSETALCDAIAMGVCRYTFVQTHRYNLLQMVDVGDSDTSVWVHPNKGPLLRGVDSRKAVRGRRGGRDIHGESLRLLFKFAANVKLLYKRGVCQSVFYKRMMGVYKYNAHPL